MKVKIVRTKMVRYDGDRMDRIELRGTQREITDLIEGCANALGTYTGRFAVETSESTCEYLEVHVEIEKPLRRRRK